MRPGSRSEVGMLSGLSPGRNDNSGVGWVETHLFGIRIVVFTSRWVRTHPTNSAPELRCGGEASRDLRGRVDEVQQFFVDPVEAGQVLRQDLLSGACVGCGGLLEVAVFGEHPGAGHLHADAEVTMVVAQYLLHGIGQGEQASVGGLETRATC